MMNAKFGSKLSLCSLGYYKVLKNISVRVGISLGLVSDPRSKSKALISGIAWMASVSSQTETRSLGLFSDFKVLFTSLNRR